MARRWHRRHIERERSRGTGLGKGIGTAGLGIARVIHGKGMALPRRKGHTEARIDETAGRGRLISLLLSATALQDR
jgi:hypothetical protein